MEVDLGKYEMEGVTLDDERERHWRIFFKDNEGGVDDEK